MKTLRWSAFALACAAASAPAGAQAQTTTWELSLSGRTWTTGHENDPFDSPFAGGPYFDTLLLTTPRQYGTFDGAQVTLSLFPSADFAHPVVIDGVTMPAFSVTTSPAPVMLDGVPQPLPTSVGFLDATAVLMHGFLWLRDSTGPTGPVATFVEFLGAGLEVRDTPDVPSYSTHRLGLWDHVAVRNAPPVPTQAVAVVPEPESWALLLAGLAAVAATVQRHRIGSGRA